MADARQSPLAPLESLSFRTCVAIGATVGVLMVGLAALLGPGDAGSTATSTKASPASTEKDDGVEEGAADNGEEGDPAGAAEDDGAHAADGDGDDADEEASPSEVEPGDPTGSEAAADDLAADDTAGTGDDAPAEDAAGSTTGDETIVEDDEPVAEDSKPAGGSTPIQESNPDAEAAMTGEELLEEANKALSERRYRDAYRLATRSYYKTKSKAALLVKGKAACGNNDAKAAKDALKTLPLGDERRKQIRTFCKDRGVRLGL